MNNIFIITLIMILVSLYFFDTEGRTNEPFCTKDGNERGCLEDFTYAKAVAGNKGVALKNNSIGPVTYVNGTQMENVIGFQCVPGNWPDKTLGGTDCYIWDSVSAVDSTRHDSSDSDFKNSAYYYNCSGVGKSLPGCRAIYNAFGQKSYKDLGYSCDLGNGTIPTKISSTGVITCVTDASGNCLVRKSKEQCQTLLNLVPTTTPIPTTSTGENVSCNNTIKTLECSKGKVGTACTDMYNKLGLKTLDELGYSCNKNIGAKNLPGKVIDNSSYNFASYDGQSIIGNCQTAINFQPLKTLNDVKCEQYTTSTDTKYPTACEQAYTTYNLYPSTNPLVIKGNDSNYSIENTFTKPDDLFSMYYKYQTSFPSNTDSNVSSSISSGIKSILSKTPLKLGCCKRTNPNDNSAKNVGVRVPVNPTIESINPYAKTFNFQNSQISLLENSCPADLYWGSSKCDNFFGLNCDNIINYMNSQNINVQSELLNYAPECACYAPQTKEQSGYPSSTPSVCYKNGCDLSSNPSVYIDPSSRNGTEVKTCSLSICNSINDFSGMNIGGTTTISTQTQNQCGSTIPSETSTSSDSSTSSTDGTTTGGTGTTTGSGTTTDGTTTDGTGTTTGSGTYINNQTSSTSDSSNIYMIIYIVIILLLLITSSASFLMR